MRDSEFQDGMVVLERGGYLNNENIEEVKIELVPFDNTTNIKICPFCHSDSIGKRKELNILTVIVYSVLGVIFPLFRKSYQCFDCDKVWKYSN